MKTALLIYSIPLLLSCNEEHTNSSMQSNIVEKKELHLYRLLDSGYIKKKEGIPFLVSHSLSDTSLSAWKRKEDNDTIGKYYKVKNTGNFFICVSDFVDGWETFLLLEIRTDGTLLKSERFYHGNYGCCLDNSNEGFKKYGDYYGLTTCGTGLGYCASNIYLFKNLTPQDKQNSIMEHYWSSRTEVPDISESLSSTMDWRKDCLILHYKLERGRVSRNFTYFKVKETKKFDVKYIFKNGLWEATDSTQLRQLDI